MSYGHPTSFNITLDGNFYETITWNASNNRWEGSVLYIRGTSGNPLKWQLRRVDNNNILRTTDGTDASNPDSPADSDFSPNWAVEDVPSAGASGDPHITPLFDDKYTI